MAPALVTGHEESSLPNESPKRRSRLGAQDFEVKIEDDNTKYPFPPGHAYHYHTLKKQVLSANHVYKFLAFLPVGIYAGIFGWNSTAVFVLNLLAIVPLATLLSFATEELSASAGQTVGALLNATFGNAVELIVSTIALTKGEIRIVQASMLGSILSNILLGLGCCIIASSCGQDSYFNATAASTMSSLMTLVSAALVIPAALHLAFGDGQTENSLKSILTLSRGASIILFVLYILYLNFQLRTHSRLFEQDDTHQQAGSEKNEESNDCRLSPLAAALTILAATFAIGICSEHLVSTVDDIVRTLHINKTFIGLIILPVVGNAAEHITAIAAATKGKMGLALNVAIGSSIQIALLITPSLVILGWAIQQPMSLYFEPFYTVVFFLSVLVVNMLIQDGESNYFEGSMMVGMYLIIAISFYVYPEKVGGV
ncbi:calcium/proton exchanger [Glonium stellatum]|uniref:Vacuolar calcium ion transporter n=1 Tax=Glonium stellatum TaxID=574774 RepID=A0A8E2EMD3_9PEZI|nr:calcium/proton exchanger [Glonium stellatum]